MRELVQKLVSIPSVFPNEKKVGDFLADYLRKLEFTVERVLTKPDRSNIVATFGKSKRYLGLYGHMDTVPPSEGRARNPYEVTEEKGKLYGLGVADMKGGVAAILKAGEFAANNKLPVKIILGVDEEGISEGAQDLIRSGLMEKINFLIVGESGQAASLKQEFSLCYGRKGRTLFAIDIFGKKAHAAESHKAINAIKKARDLLSLIETISIPYHPRLGEAQIIIHSIRGETDSFSIPETCHMEVSVLTTPNYQSTQFAQDVKALAEKNNIRIGIKEVYRKTPYGVSYEVDRNNDILKIIESGVLNAYHIQPGYATSVADENIFAHAFGVPVITIGPIGGGDHTDDEWLDFDSLLAVEKVYKEIIELYNSLEKQV